MRVTSAYTWKTIERLSAGKRQWRGARRVDGRWPYGEHPSHEFDDERKVCARIRKWHGEGMTAYAIAKQLRAQGIRTRPSKGRGSEIAVGREFTVTAVTRILERLANAHQNSLL